MRWQIYVWTISRKGEEVVLAAAGTNVGDARDKAYREAHDLYPTLGIRLRDIPLTADMTYDPENFALVVFS